MLKHPIRDERIRNLKAEGMVEAATRNLCDKLTSMCGMSWWIDPIAGNRWTLICDSGVVLMGDELNEIFNWLAGAVYALEHLRNGRKAV